MAHDMNNVLAGILGTAEMLRDRFPADDPVARSLDSIVYASGRGRDLVRALTDFARKGLVEPQPFDLNDLLRKEVELLRHATLQKVPVVLDLDPFLPALLGDASALGGTIMNLAVNALDAMPDGGTLSFRSRVHRHGGIELTVTDTGQGMAPEVLARAMEPFFTTKPAGKGTGLGLARAYGTVKAHGGSMAIHSAPGQGTTITLMLPSFQQIRGEEPETEGAAARTDLGDTLRILLVDDDPVILETMPPLLESLGHAVTTACRGEEALARLGAGLEVDLVVLDHNMPGLTGTETLVRLRERHPELPVILATGFVESFTENLVTSLPRVWLLKKPYSLREIRKALATACVGAAV
jgi:CheY-like chemotaxis protein